MDNISSSNEKFADAVPSHCGVSTSSDNDDSEGGDSSIFWAAATTQATMVNDYVPKPSAPVVPHRGMLRRIHSAAAVTPTTGAAPSGSSVSSSKSSTTAMSTYTTSAAPSFVYALSIAVPPDRNDSEPVLIDTRDVATLELRFEKKEYDLLLRLFSILDSESKGSVAREAVREFVRLRCPVFRRRDRALRKYGRNVAYQKDERLSADVGVDSRSSSSTTFDETWDAVMECGTQSIPPGAQLELGLEGWMVFCRLVALAQYQEAKRRFSVRHSQQTMRHKSGGTEVVLVDVPPPDPPEPLSARELADHEASSTTALTLPELDLDHCLVSAHDVGAERDLRSTKKARVEVQVFGSGKRGSSLLSSVTPSSPRTNKTSDLDFVVTYHPAGYESSSTVVVRRSFADMEWLCDTYALHKSPGGTLCGRILPPFPSQSIGRSSASGESDRTKNYSVTGNVVAAGSSAAIAAASAGVGMITSVAKSAKSLLGGYMSSTASGGEYINDVRQRASKSTKVGSTSGRLGWYNRESASAGSSFDKAKQIERYLNYLLEHPALCTSFPLNVILKASQSGLESAKRILADHAKQHDRQRRQQQEITQIDEDKAASYYLSPSLISRLPSADTMYTYQPNLSWVRSAAQAAVALKLHGILETTGMPSASAKLQHASLPYFDSGNQRYEREEDSDRSPKSAQDENDRVARGSKKTADFESGVVAVASELENEACLDGGDEGYDMLPSPVPPPEHGVLCAGSSDDKAATIPLGTIGSVTSSSKEGPRYDYGSHLTQDAVKSEDSAAVLGDLSVDKDIDKLREVIGSVDNLMNRCLSAGSRIGKAKQKENVLHVGILRGMDSWEGLRGELISQRALLKGVSALEDGNETTENGFASLTNDLSWQSLLASSAVSAAEDVRSSVRASRTASRAKLAAEAASKTAQKACETGVFPTPDDARAAQTKASIAHSHAIHSAVIEHEAMTAKRRSAMALAHDVKCWNVHRKRELLALCRDFAHNQREASHQSFVAWNHLREGFIGSSPVAVQDVQGEHQPASNVANTNTGRPVPEVLSFSLDSSIDTFGLGSSLGRDLPVLGSSNESHDLDLGASLEQEGADSRAHVLYSNVNTSNPVQDDLQETCSNVQSESVPESKGSDDGDDDNDNDDKEEEQGISIVDAGNADFPARTPIISADDLASEASQEFNGSNVHNDDCAFEHNDESQDDEEGFENSTEMRRVGGEFAEEQSEIMTGSMQSLVDGLMNWGGQYESEDFDLPPETAISMMLEESGVVSKNLDEAGIINPDIL